MSTSNRELTTEEKLRRYEEQQARTKRQYERQAAKNTLYMQRAKEAGITVTEAEIDAYIASKPSRK